ncbi:MAG: RHS repeat protein, partial [Caldilineaceae bacterium]|nr:RHS repeat protein [Caldilineaceae bacterium]
MRSNSHVLFGSPSVFSLQADPDYSFFQLDVGDGSDLIFSTDPTIPFTYLYPEPGIYEYQLSAFGSSDEAFVITGTHTVSEFMTSPWPEPKLNYDDGDLFACDSCPDDQGAILDPIYLHNGEFFLMEEDLRIPGRGFDYRFQRTYKSQLSFDGRMGHNWTHNYMQHLAADGLNIVQVNGNGRRDAYTSSDGVSFTAPAGFYTSLTRNSDETYTIREAYGGQALFNALDGSPAQGRLRQISDRNGNTMHFLYDAGGRLERVIDTLGRPIYYIYNTDERLAYIEDFIGRRVSFTYDLRGDLVAVTSPAVTGTPNGNDFPNGKSWRYTYSSGFGNDRLNHNLLTIIAPNEVADGTLKPHVINTYAGTTNPLDYNFDRVITQQWGGTNASGVPAGGTLTVTYEELNPSGDPTDLTLPRNRTTVIDRNGNQKVYEHNGNGHRLTLKEYSNRDIRPGDPEFWETVYRFNRDGQLLQTIYPAGNVIESRYDETNRNRLQQGNRIADVQRADPIRGGDQRA